MQFLNPFVLIGLAAAGIPVLLHLLNLRRLRVVEFSTLRFLQELQQTRVRRLKMQQILLLVLRTLLVLFVVLAFARPTIPTVVPVLGVEARTSVVVIVDNSGSMEAADQRGERFLQAKAAAKSIIESLAEGDEVAVLPMAGLRSDRSVTFTRTFAAAIEQVDRLERSADRADVITAVRMARMLLTEASHGHHDIVFVTDAQENVMPLGTIDTLAAASGLERFVVLRIGDGLRGVEQNFSVDSVAVLTTLPQQDKPIEVEAWIRNGGEASAESVPVSMSFGGTRVAQRGLDIPAGETRSIVLSAPPQRRGTIDIAIELDDDALSGDNKRYAGVLIPTPPRVALVGSYQATSLLEIVFGVGGYSTSLPRAESFRSLASAIPLLAGYDVLYICDGLVSESERAAVRQYVERGGTLVLFASDDKTISAMSAAVGIRMDEVSEAVRDAPYRVTKVEAGHPLFSGVFKAGTNARLNIDMPSVVRQRVVSGSEEIMSTSAGGLVAEGAMGAGRVLAIGVAPNSQWGGLTQSGVFPALIVRSALYLALPRNQTLALAIGERAQIMVPAKLAGRSDLRWKDAMGIVGPAPVLSFGSESRVVIPPQFVAGVVSVSTSDSMPVALCAVNRPMEESMLSFLSNDAFGKALKAHVRTDAVAMLDGDRSIAEAYQRIRLGSELWPLLIVLALMAGIAETLVARFWAREEPSSGTISAGT